MSPADEHLGGLIWSIIFVGVVVLAVVCGIMTLIGSMRGGGGPKDPFNP